MKTTLLYFLICFSSLMMVFGENQGSNTPKKHRRPRSPAVEDYFKTLKQQNPEEMKRLRDLRQTDPEAFRKELRNRVNKKKGHGKRRQDPRKVFDEHLQHIQQAETPEARAQAEQKLKDAVEERIDKGLMLREKAIARMQEQLKTLEERHLNDKQNRDQLISRQVESLLNELDSNVYRAKED